MKHLSKEGSSSPNGGQNGGAEGTSLLVNGIRTAKNLRRPRNGYGRGLPKKGKLVLFLLLGQLLRIFVSLVPIDIPFLTKLTCFLPFFGLSSLPRSYLPKEGGLEKKGGKVSWRV